VLGDDALVARAEIDMAEQAEQFVGTVAAQDIGLVQPVHFGDRLAQRRGLAVGIDLQMAGALLEGVDRLRAGAHRCFVRRQLEDPRDTGGMLLAGHIGGNVEDTRTRSGLHAVAAHR